MHRYSLVAVAIAGLCFPFDGAIANGNPPAVTAVNEAIAACLAAAATGRFETRTPADTYLMTDRSFGRVHSINEAPGLVKRFISTSSGGLQPQLVHRFLSDKGGVWLVVRTVVDRCDIAITGMDDPQLGDATTAFFGASAGWQAVLRQEPNATMPLARSIFVKAMPQPGLSKYAMVATVRNLGIRAETADGVQIEINIAVGNVTNASGTISVSTVRPPPK